MPDKPQSGMTEDQAITALRNRPADARKALLAKMDPATKQRVLAKLSAAAPTGPAKASTKDLSVLDPNFQREKTAEKHANAVDYILDQLPTAVGTGASMLGGSKKLPTGMAAAAAGGVLGEDARELLGKHLYNDPARKADVSNMTAKDAVEKLATAGAEQSGAELVGRGVSGTVSKIAEKLGLTGAAKSAAAAAAGNGVQKTPGEVSGNRAQQFLEHFLSYMPGAMGPMGHFEEMRAGQTAEMVTKQLDQISSQNLTREQTGEAVSKVIKDMKGSAAQESNLAYNPLKKPLGLPEDATRAQIEEAARKAASPHAGSLLDASGKPVMVPGDGGAAMRSLRAADAAHGAAQDKIEPNLVTKIANTNRVEAVHRYVADASIADLRAILPKLAPETRQAVARNVMEDAFAAGRDPVSGEFNAKAALKALSTLDKDGPKSALLFGKNAATVREALKEIAAIQHGHSPGGGMAGHRVMSTIILALPQAALGVLTGHVPETLALVGGEMGAARMLSGLITNPETSLKVLTALRRMAAGTIRVGGPAVTDLIRQESLPPPASQAMTASPTAQFMSQH